MRNIIHENLFSENKQGIFLCCGAINNLFYHNSFLNNTEGHIRGSNRNEWQHENKGNYWDDYTGKDANGDGIGDSPYEIEGGVTHDSYPLINQII